MESKETNYNVNSLKNVVINASLYDTYAVTSISQEYHNETSNAQEIVLSVPIGDNTVVKSMQAKIGEILAVSKVYETEKAKEKYIDSLSQGNTGIISTVEEDKPDELEMKIGNLPPGEKLVLNIDIINKITSEDCSRKYHLVLSRLPELVVEKTRLKLRPCNCKFDDSIVSTTEWNREERVKRGLKCKMPSHNVPVTFSATYISPSKIMRFASLAHENSTNFSEDYKIGNMVVSWDQLINSESHEITILFKSEDLNLPRIYHQFNPKLNKYSYMLSYQLDQRNTYTKQESPDTDPKITYLDKYESKCINDTPSTFIFLLDQSGSMNSGPLDTAKEALIMFIKSLPPNSQFSVIGFGSTYIDYFGVLKYNSKNVAKAIKKIETLSANLNGTNILSPLEYVYKNTNYSQSLAKNVFLLTDGKVNDSKDCLELIKTNNRTFRVHSLGIGSGVSKTFITDCGIVGKGSAEFAVELTEIKRKVIKALNHALQFYFSNVSFEFNNNAVPECEYPNKDSLGVLYQDEVLTYAFITSSPLDPESELSFNAKAAASDSISAKFKVKDILFDMGEDCLLEKYIVGFKCKSEKNMDEKESVTLGCTYQVLTKGTSLFVEMENNNSSTAEMKTVRIPSVYISNKVNLNKMRNVQLPVNQKLSEKGGLGMLGKFSWGGLNLGKTSVDYKPQNEVKVAMKAMSKPSSAAPNNFLAKRMEKSFKSSLNLSPTASFSTNGNSSANSNTFLKKKSAKITSTGSSKASINKNSTPTSNSVTTVYNNILISQAVEGYWSLKLDTSDTLKKILNSSKQSVDAIRSALENLNVQKGVIEDLILTIIIIHYLYSRYSSLKDEFFLISNKAKKYLLSNGVNYEDISQSLIFI